MRLRTLLVATTASTMLVAAAPGDAAYADPVAPSASPGRAIVWGDPGDPTTSAAMKVPDDLTALIVDVAVSDVATAAVTTDGRLYVWGRPGASEVDLAPTAVTDAVAVSLTAGNGAVVHENGSVSVWGESAELKEGAPTTGIRAISLSADTGYATDHTGLLRVWGAAPAVAPPTAAFTGLVDVSAGPTQVLTRRYDNTVLAWSDPSTPELETVPNLRGKRVTQIATGAGVNGLVLTDGTIRVWGPAAPAGQPDFGDKKVISLDVAAGSAGAVTEDGVVHTWGSNAAINAVPSSLSRIPATTIAMGAKHAAVIGAYRTLSEPRIGGTPEVGQTLTVTPGVHTFTPGTISGQWYAGTLPIDGQTGTTLRVDDTLLGTSLSYRSTSTLAGVSLTSKSEPVGPVTRAGSATSLTVVRGKTAGRTTWTAVATASRSGGIPTGTITFAVGTASRTIVVRRGKASWMLPHLAAGTHEVAATYSGSPSTSPSAAAPAALTVRKAASKVRAKAKVRGKAGGNGITTRVPITIRVTTDKRLSPAGRVTIALAGRKVTTSVDASGTARVILRKVSRGTHTLKVTYAGNSDVSGSKGRMRFRV